MLMKDVVGLQAAKTSLMDMIAKNRLPHALLLLGAEGTGGLPLALAFAQYVFCTARNGHDACGNCADCQKAQKLEHPDLHISFPAIPPKPKTKAMSRFYIQEFRKFVAQAAYGSTYDWLQFIGAENKQGNIPAEECREIIETLSLKSYEGGKKIQIIWRPEYLGKEGNILLKLIEEPPAGTLLLFVAEQTEDILPTILSRVQTVKLPALSPADIAQALSDRSLADAHKAAQTAQIANGNFAEALRLVKHTDNDLFPDVKRWFNALFTNKGLEISKIADDWSKKGREQQKNILQYVIQLLELAIRKQYLPDYKPALPEPEAIFIGKLSSLRLSHNTMQLMIKAITDTSFYIERNAHGKTQLHALSIKLVHAIQNRVISV